MSWFDSCNQRKGTCQIGTPCTCSPIALESLLSSSALLTVLLSSQIPITRHRTLLKMSHFSTETQRPAMRRKSSAQNLLSSFKPNSTSVPPPLNLASSSAANTTNLSFASVVTPTASTTPINRDWDAQSLHSDTVGSNLAGAQSPQLGQGTSVEYLRDLVQKRIITLTYIRNVHEG